MKKRLMLAVFMFFFFGVFTQAVILTYFEEDGDTDFPRGLYDFDTTTGISKLRTPMSGSERLFSFAVHPSNGKVYAASGHDSYDNGFYEVDISTGNLTLIGTPGSAVYKNIDFDPSTGMLYGRMTTGTFGQDFTFSLVTIDVATGNPTIIGKTHDQTLISFSDTGELFGLICFNGYNDDIGVMGDLFNIDKYSGNYSFIGATTPFQKVAEDTVFVDGYIYSTDWGGNIFKTDPDTGVGVLIGNTGMGNGLGGIFIIPEPATLSLLTLGAFLAGRRRD